MSQLDIRWHQRLENFKKAYAQLNEAIELTKKRDLTKLEKQGLIQAFEYNHELGWNCLKDYFLDQGMPNITGSKDATREAFKVGLVSDGDAWMSMIKSRNLTSHTYNQEVTDAIVANIINSYFDEFGKLIDLLESKK